MTLGLQKLIFLPEKFEDTKDVIRRRNNTTTT
jgi:hypothetical protein